MTKIADGLFSLFVAFVMFLTPLITPLALLTIAGVSIVGALFQMRHHQRAALH